MGLLNKLFGKQNVDGKSNLSENALSIYLGKHGLSFEDVNEYADLKAVRGRHDLKRIALPNVFRSHPNLARELIRKIDEVKNSEDYSPVPGEEQREKVLYSVFIDLLAQTASSIVIGSYGCVDCV